MRDGSMSFRFPVLNLAEPPYFMCCPRSWLREILLFCCTVHYSFIISWFHRLYYLLYNKNWAVESSLSRYFCHLKCRHITQPGVTSVITAQRGGDVCAFVPCKFCYTNVFSASLCGLYTHIDNYISHKVALIGRCQCRALHEHTMLTLQIKCKNCSLTSVCFLWAHIINLEIALIHKRWTGVRAEVVRKGRNPIHTVTDYSIAVIALKGCALKY